MRQTQTIKQQIPPIEFEGQSQSWGFTTQSTYWDQSSALSFVG